MVRTWLPTLLLLVLLPLNALAAGNDDERRLHVTASAFTLAPDETQTLAPGITAWGDRLKPGMKAIAISRDLIPKGLTHDTEVTIEGLDGTYRVLDKMNRRWTRKIDIFMGHDRQRALQWGVQDVTISWPADTD